MSGLKTILSRIFGVAAALVMLPIFAFFGLVLIGVALVASVVGSIALRSHIKKMQEDLAASRAQQQARWKGENGKFRDGPVIDLEANEK